MPPVKLLDTAHEARDQTADHARRLALMGDVLAQALSGEQVDAASIAAACPSETADCLVTFLRQRGGERGLFVAVQKSSTLILQVFATLVDLPARQVIARRELNFRGDNDESWRRAALFLAREFADGTGRAPAR
ncbi:DUF2380 domain-containing protein [Paracoccus limosus]|uniref:DUF2380 domain-containing protein n=1 Tax=Paracoccus limosus TaxID=913252 RepID=A0A844H354_9RHOB|nr:DUF2380 domain-containing protein [Paracoccus limosus]